MAKYSLLCMSSTCWFPVPVENRQSGPPVFVAWSCQCYSFLTAVMGSPSTDANISCCPNTLQLLSMPFWLFATFLNCPLQLHRHALYHGCINHLIAPVRLCPLILISQNTDLCLLLPFVDLSSLVFSRFLLFLLLCTLRVLYSDFSPQ